MLELGFRGEFARDLRAVVMEISEECRFFTFRSRMSI
jgi:hypothetical protein